MTLQRRQYSRSSATEVLERSRHDSLSSILHAGSQVGKRKYTQVAQVEVQSTPNFRISDEVFAALKKGHPVVALETTIYTHGFPYPDNVGLALDLEKIVRNHGAVPATIGILEGVARVGLSETELTALASTAGDPATMKVSRRDLPYILGMVSL